MPASLGFFLHKPLKKNGHLCVIDNFGRFFNALNVEYPRSPERVGLIGRRQRHLQDILGEADE